MDIGVAQELLKHLWLESDNCTCPIKNAWFSVQEVSRSTRIERLEIVDCFKILLAKKVIEKISDEPLLFQFTEFGKSIKSIEDIEKYIA